MDDPIKLEKKRRRFINDIKAGRRKTIGEEIINDPKYKWTVEDKEFIQPFIRSRNQNVITNVTICDSCVTKKEAFELLDKHVENKNTLKNYKSRVNTLLKIMQVDDENFSSIFCKSNIKKLLSTLINSYKDPTSYFGFILFILSKSTKLTECVPKDTFDIVKKNFDDYKSRQTVKQLQDRREDVNYERVYKHIFNKEQKYNTELFASMKHVISVMYTHALYDNNGTIHMIPRNYFVQVMIVENDKKMNTKDNFYNVNTGRLLINDYKTSKLYEPYDIFLTPKVKKIIKTSLEKLPRKYLITQPDGSLYSDNSLSEIVKKYLNYNIGVIRKSIESYEFNVNHTDRTHLAMVSRHTVLTQEVSYLAH